MQHVDRELDLNYQLNSYKVIRALGQKLLKQVGAMPN